MAVAAPERRHPTSLIESNLITTRLWRKGDPPAAVELDHVRTGEGVLQFDVDSEADPVVVYEALRPICGDDLTLAMVQDLLEPDALPQVKHQDESGRIRAVSAFGVDAIKPAPDAGTCSGRLVFNLVEFLANDHWLVTCAHTAQSYAGAGAPEAHAVRDGCRELACGVTRRWVGSGCETAGDLGVLFLHELACSYSDAWREMMSWLDRWERRLYDDPEVERATLKDLRGLAAEFRARLNALNVPQDEAGSAWFAGVTATSIAKRADRHIDRALQALDRLGDMLRSAFGVLQANATARQLELAQEQQRKTEGLQHKLELVTVLFLVPTLIAGAWGENTWVPGEGSPWGFAATIVTMLAGALLARMWLKSRREPAADAA